MPELSIRYVTYTGKFPKNLSLNNHFEDVYEPVNIPHHLLAVLNTVDHLGIYILVKNKETYTLLVNQKEIVITPKNVKFNGQTYDFRKHLYRVPMFEYIFNRCLTEEDNNVLKLRTASRYISELDESTAVNIIKKADEILFNESVEHYSFDHFIFSALFLSMTEIIGLARKEYKKVDFANLSLQHTETNSITNLFSPLMSTSNEDLEEAIKHLKVKLFYKRLVQIVELKRLRRLNDIKIKEQQEEAYRKQEDARRKREELIIIEREEIERKKKNKEKKPKLSVLLKNRELKSRD